MAAENELHPSVIIGAIAMAIGWTLLSRFTRANPTRRQTAAFAAGLGVMVFALTGPIDELADDRSFSMHMLQHLLITLAVPPLLLLGLNARMLRPALRIGWIRSSARWLTNPLPAFLIYNAILIWLHTPAAYERMCRDETFHIAMHLTLMASAVIMWWPMLSPTPELPRLSYPAQMLYLFFLTIPMAAISAPITLSASVLYPWYLEGPHPLGIAPLADQVLGGLLMWVGAGCYIILIFTVVFYRWAQYEDRDQPVVGLRLTGT